MNEIPATKAKEILENMKKNQLNAETPMSVYKSDQMSVHKVMVVINQEKYVSDYKDLFDKFSFNEQKIRVGTDRGLWEIIAKPKY